MFTITQLIETVEQIRRMESRLPLLRAAVREGGDPARLHTTEANLKQLRDILPATYAFPEAIQRAADHRIEHDNMVAQLLDIEKKITAAKDVAKTQAWKYTHRKDGPKEPAEVTALREQHAVIDAKIEAIDEAISPLMRVLAAEEKAQAEATETRMWAARGFMDPVPECILRMRAADAKELEAGCERLKMPKMRSYVFAV
jgi:hypothetical protein